MRAEVNTDNASSIGGRVINRKLEIMYILALKILGENAIGDNVSVGSDAVKSFSFRSCCCRRFG